MLGRHQGLPLYTVGQRRKIGISAPEPLYVVQIDVAGNRLVVGTASQAGRSEFRVVEARFVNGIPPVDPVTAGGVDLAEVRRCTGRPMSVGGHQARAGSLHMPTST